MLQLENDGLRKTRRDQVVSDVLDVPVRRLNWPRRKSRSRSGNGLCIRRAAAQGDSCGGRSGDTAGELAVGGRASLAVRRTSAAALPGPSPLRDRVSACITLALRSCGWNGAVPPERRPPGLGGPAWPHVGSTAGSGRVDRTTLGSTLPLPSPGTRLGGLTRRECGQGTAGGGLPLRSSAQKMRRRRPDLGAAPWPRPPGSRKTRMPGGDPGPRPPLASRSAPRPRPAP